MTKREIGLPRFSRDSIGALQDTVAFHTVVEALGRDHVDFEHASTEQTAQITSEPGSW